MSKLKECAEDILDDRVSPKSVQDFREMLQIVVDHNIMAGADLPMEEVERIWSERKEAERQLGASREEVERLRKENEDLKKQVRSLLWL